MHFLWCAYFLKIRILLEICMQNHDGFMYRYYSVFYHVTPCLASGFLGMSSIETLNIRCKNFHVFHQNILIQIQLCISAQNSHLKACVYYVFPKGSNNAIPTRGIQWRQSSLHARRWTLRRLARPCSSHVFKSARVVKYLNVQTSTDLLGNAMIREFLYSIYRFLPFVWCSWLRFSEAPWWAHL